MPNAPFAGRIDHLLVAEDSIILAMDIEESLEELGVAKVSVVSDAGSALALLDGGGVDGALVDFFLGADDGRLVTERLTALGIPFALMTGFSDLDWLRSQVPGAPILTKPFSRQDLTATLETLF